MENVEKKTVSVENQWGCMKFSVCVVPEKSAAATDYLSEEKMLHSYPPEMLDGLFPLGFAG